MEAVQTSEILINSYQSIWCYNAEASHLPSGFIWHRLSVWNARRKLKSQEKPRQDREFTETGVMAQPTSRKAKIRMPIRPKSTSNILIKEVNPLYRLTDCVTRDILAGLNYVTNKRALNMEFLFILQLWQALPETKHLS
jgi:hypothetical protein